VFDNITHFAFEFEVVALDLMKPDLLVPFELFIDGQNALNFSLFGCNNSLEDVDFVIIETCKIALSLQIGLPFLAELTVVEGS
jgi:hypothetical protein